MVDYYSILTRAVASLSPNTREQRRDLYDRAQMTLVDKLRAVDPTLSDPALNAERAALEAAIQRVERDALRSAAPRRPAHVASPPARGYRDRPPLRDTRKPLRIAAGALGAVLIVLAGVAIYSFWPRSIADLKSISKSANGNGRRRGTDWQVRLCQSAAIGVLPDEPACRDDHRR